MRVEYTGNSNEPTTELTITGERARCMLVVSMTVDGVLVPPIRPPAHFLAQTTSSDVEGWIGDASTSRQRLRDAR